jgi:hypothetical protein
MMTRPVAAAKNTSTAGTEPGGTSKPRVNRDEPAVTKAAAAPWGSNGHSSNEIPR